MISSEVQRTLVKSPPELWAELSDPESLSRHLGELGEIRITRSEPEKRVEWESESSSGSVLIKPSGWGTKVTLSVTREVVLPDTPEPISQAQPVLEAEPVVETEPAGEPELAAEEEPPAEPIDEVEGMAAEAQVERAEEPVPTEIASTATIEEPRRGFFARVFGRRKPSRPKTIPPSVDESQLLASTEEASAPSGSPSAHTAPASTTEIPQQATPSAIESLQARFHAEAPPREPAQKEASSEANVQLATDDQPAAEKQQPADGGTPGSVGAEEQTPPADIAAELQAAEEVAVEQVTALLTGVLDRLGAAHHRPFSRS